MKQDNGNHASRPWLWFVEGWRCWRMSWNQSPETANTELVKVVWSFLADMTTERDRLKAINAELVEALEAVTERFEGALDSTIHATRGDRQDIRQARAALVKARKEG